MLSQPRGYTSLLSGKNSPASVKNHLGLEFVPLLGGDLFLT